MAAGEPRPVNARTLPIPEPMKITYTGSGETRCKLADRQYSLLKPAAYDPDDCVYHWQVDRSSRLPQHNLRRCEWVPVDDPTYARYHDEEWGVPVHSDQKFFEFLLLEGAQAGLSWRTILNRRENYRMAFDGFDPQGIAVYDEKKFRRLLSDAGIIRNGIKIRAAIQNARAFLQVQRDFDSFDAYVWSFVDNRPKINSWRRLEEIPVISAESEALSKDLRQRGFKFVGSTICYAFMQATGLVNDHLTYCFRYRELSPT